MLYIEKSYTAWVEYLCTLSLAVVGQVGCLLVGSPCFLLGMVTTTQIRRYAWVVELLLRRERLTIREINDEWARSSLANYNGEKVDRKTWYKCFEDIGMIYGILIDGVRKANNSHWFILNPEALQSKNVQEWMLACVAHRNLLEECIGMYNRTDIEGFPSENGMLQPITHAMKENRKLEVLYRRYGNKVPKRYIVEPYFIKTYNHRFYVLCKFDTAQFFTLSFDRMIEVKELNQHFNFPNDLFAQEFFEDAFGVMIPPGAEEPLDIVFRAKGDARFYLEDVPIHKSQRLIKDGEDYADFAVHIRPTEDFIGAVLQQGERLEIIRPEKVRNRIKMRLENALKPYVVA